MLPMVLRHASVRNYHGAPVPSKNPNSCYAVSGAARCSPRTQNAKLECGYSTASSASIQRLLTGLACIYRSFSSIIFPLKHSTRSVEVANTRCFYPRATSLGRSPCCSCKSTSWRPALIRNASPSWPQGRRHPGSKAGTRQVRPDMYRDISDRRRFVVGVAVTVLPAKVQGKGSFARRSRQADRHHGRGPGPLRTR